RSFKEALSTPKGVGNQKGRAEVLEEKESETVAWEVDVEEEKFALLRGAFVGFLLEDLEAQQLQQYFSMDEYHDIKITTLGHLKVLITSPKEEEVKSIVRSVGWWCKWFHRFVSWSPATTSNHRE
ncbi:hypothetical protein A2U01_0057294, partial [Trifolium medium]|nr:hypothetical protein [Trifolium medium]